MPTLDPTHKIAAMLWVAARQETQAADTKALSPAGAIESISRFARRIMTKSVRARDCALVADYYPLDCYTRWGECGPKIPVGTVGTRTYQSQNGGCGLVLLQTPVHPALRWAGVCQMCERFSQVFLAKGLGLSDPLRPPEIKLERRTAANSRPGLVWVYQDCGCACACRTHFLEVTGTSLTSFTSG
jgi:hypothetical protein